MSRAFSTARQSLARWLGYNKDSLPQVFEEAAERYAENGAVAEVGEIDSIEILYGERLTTLTSTHLKFMCKAARHQRLIYYYPRSLCGLSTAERTGSPIFLTLWSYVRVPLVEGIISKAKTKNWPEA